MVQRPRGQTGGDGVVRAIGLPALAAGLALALLSGCGSSAAPAAGAAGAGAQVVTAVPPPAVPDLPMATWAKRITGYLPARDGTLLKYSVLLPAATGRFPTIVNYSGYDAGSIGGSQYQAGNTAMDPDLDQRLLAAGYAVMGVNMAGTACSEGVFDLFAPRWSTDGYDAIEWGAQQAWSNGDFGMANWSYAGLSQYLTAIAQPPHLRAIAPGMLVTDPWRDVGYPGGVTNLEFPATWWIYIQSQWSNALQSAVTEADATCIANVARNEVVAQPYSPLAFLFEYPFPEGSDNGQPLASRQVWQYVDQINVPVFSVIAWQDEATGPRGGYYQDGLDPQTTYVVGMNGQHDSYESKILQSQIIRFFDHYIKGVDNGIDSQPHVQLWEDTTQPDGTLPNLTPREVLAVDRFPVTVRPLQLALRAGGVLSADPAAAGEGPESYDYPLRGPSVNGLFGLDPWPGSTPSTTASLSYTTAPLAQTLTFYGPASANLWVSSSAAPNADIQVTVTEVRPDGNEEYVARGWLDLQQRLQETALETPTRPFLVYTTEAAQPLSPGQAVYGRVEINRFSHIFRQGSSIRIWLDTPSETGEWGFISAASPTRLTIYHDTDHPSALVLGLLMQGGIGTPLPLCGSNTYQPCRPNPMPIPAGAGPDGSTADPTPVVP